LIKTDIDILLMKLLLIHF